MQIIKLFIVLCVALGAGFGFVHLNNFVTSSQIEIPNIQAQILRDQERLNDIDRILLNPTRQDDFLKNTEDKYIYDQFITLKAQRDSLAQRYGQRHPIMVGMDQQIHILQSRVQDMKDTYYKDLEKERVLLTTRMEQSKKQIVVVPKTTVSSLPLWGCVLSLILGVIAFYLRAKYTWSYGQFGKILKPSFVFSIPALPKFIEKRFDYVIDFPASRFTESLRILRTDLQTHTKYTENPKRAYLITGLNAQQACCDVAVGIAKLAARHQERAVILEADLRSPFLAKLYHATPNQTVTDYLTGRAKLEDCVVRTGAHQPHIIYASAIPSTAADMVAGDKMATLIASLRQMYDVCLVIAPDMNLYADTRILSQHADAMIVMNMKGAASFPVTQALKSADTLGRKPILWGFGT